MRHFSGKGFLLLGLLILAAIGPMGCGKNAYLERNVDYVADDILIEQEEVLKEDLGKVKAVYDEALRSGEQTAIEGAEAQYKDYQEKYKIVVDELKSRFGKNDWEQAVAAKRAKKAASQDSASPAIKESPLDASPPPAPAGMGALGKTAIDAPIGEAPPAAVKAEPAAPMAQGEKAVQPAAPAAGVGGTYVVGRGDSLSAIAARFKVPGDAILRANNLNDPDKLNAGQTLVIPGIDQAISETAPGAEILVEEVKVEEVPAASEQAAPEASSAPETYVVKSGDTLKAIAIRFGVNSKALMEKNNMADPDKLKLGQTLILR